MRLIVSKYVKSLEQDVSAQLVDLTSTLGPFKSSHPDQRDSSESVASHAALWLNIVHK